MSSQERLTSSTVDKDNAALTTERPEPCSRLKESF